MMRRKLGRSATDLAPNEIFDKLRELCDAKLGRISSVASLYAIEKGGDHAGEFDDGFVCSIWVPGNLNFNSSLAHEAAVDMRP